LKALPQAPSDSIDWRE